MKNFGFKNLVLVNPLCKINDEAINRAKHAKEILMRAKVVKKMPRMDFLVATSAKTAQNVNRIPIDIKEMKKKISGKVGIVFGRESSGLTNIEMEQCDIFVSIPTSKKYPTMNLSHAVAVLLYELSGFKHSKTFAEKKEREAVMMLAEEILKRVSFSKPDKKNRIRTTLSRVFSRSEMRKKECLTIAGFFRKIMNSLDKKKI